MNMNIGGFDDQDDRRNVLIGERKGKERKREKRKEKEKKKEKKKK